jgi:hypothetical protein
MESTSEKLLAVVRRSPERVAVHDRAGWLALFTDDAVIEDPIGSPPAAKADGVLGRFWDTFIAPHDIDFEIRRDHFLGQDVFRDAVIHTRIGAHIQIDVPAYLLYQLEERGGTLQVRRMAAHWQLGKLSLGALRLGPRAWVAMTLLFGRMMRVMGLGWVGGYLSSLWNGIGGRGTAALTALAAAVAERDEAALTALFAPGAEIELGAARAPDLLSLLPPGSRLLVEAPVAAGWTVSCRYRLEGPSPSAGLALLEFAPGSKQIERARFFAA